MTETETQSDRNVSRLIGFTDGVVAIAITLVVLPLVDSARSLGSKPAAEWLDTNRLSIFAAALSFYIIASFWKDHHRLYRRVIASTPLLVNVNLLWLAGIVFLPLPTVLIVDSPGHDPVAASLYIATILATEVSIRIQEVIVVRSKLLRPSEIPPARYLWADWVVVALTTVALIVTLAIPETGLYPLLLTIIGLPVGWILRGGFSASVNSRRIL